MSPIEPASNKQVEFGPMQTHVKTFEIAMVAFSVICVIIVLVIVLGTDIGNLKRP
jgi:hypothetical protein